MAARVVGRDPLENHAIWLSRSRTRPGGTATAAGSPATRSSAIDIALWDVKGKLLGTSRARPARRPRPRPAAGDRLLPRPLRGHRRRWSRRPRSGSRPGCKGVKVGFGKRGNARLGYEHDRDVAYMRAMREGLAPDKLADDRLRLERQVGRHDGRPAGPGVRGVRPRLDRGAARRLGSRGLREPAVEDDDADRLRREGMGPRGLRADPRDRARSTSSASTRAGPRASPASAGAPTGSRRPGARPTPTPGRRRSARRRAWR